MQVSCGDSALEMFERELGQVFSCPTTLSSELGQRGSTPGTGWSGMMWTCHQETLQVLLMAGPDHQQAGYPTCILCTSSNPHTHPGTGLLPVGDITSAHAVDGPTVLTWGPYQPIPGSALPSPGPALLRQLTPSPPLYSSPRRNTSLTHHQRSFTRSWKRS